MKVVYWLTGLAVVFILLAALGSNTSNDGRSKDRRVIELCWSDQGKKSLEPDSARHLAGMCERMEDDFRRKYGVSP